MTNELAKLSLLQNISSNTATIPDLALTQKNSVFSNGAGGGSAQRTNLVAGMFKSLIPTLQDGDQSELLVDDQGNLKVTFSGVVSTLNVGTSDVRVTNFPGVQLTTGDLPSVTDTHRRSAATANGTDFLKIGGYDASTSEYSIARFESNELLVKESNSLATRNAVESIDTKVNGLALNTSVNAQTTILNNINNKLPTVLGQGTMAQSSKVVIASDQSAIPVTSATIATQALQTSGNASLTTIAANSVTQATAANQTAGNSSLTTIAANTPTVGIKDTTGSSPVVLSNGLSIERTSIVNPAINYDYLTNTTSTTSWFDASAYNFMSFTVNASVASGTIVFEQTNDNFSTTGQPVIGRLNSTLATTGINSLAITTVPQNVEIFLTHRYIRIRQSVAAVAGVNLRALFKQTSPVNPSVFLNGGSVAIGSGTVNTVQSVTSANLSVPVGLTDQGSAAITTTTISGVATPSFGTVYQVTIPVTAISGTLPTYDVIVQESDDFGANWYDVYSFPRITTVGIYRSPVLMLTGNRIRYTQTITGTTPSFTRSILRNQMSSTPTSTITQLIDRAINPNTLNSTTSSLRTHNARNAQLK